MPVLQRYLETIQFGTLQVFSNMVVVPLFTTLQSAIHYLTLQQALDQQKLKITELSESGSVPELKVANQGELPVLLLDGEELMGAKQNRVLNTTILLKPNSETVIPVSCTEQGRWGYSSREFSSSGHVLSHATRSKKSSAVYRSLQSGRGYTSDQGEVWQEIRQLSDSAQVASPTGAMRDVYESHAKPLSEYEQAFEWMPQQQGLLVIINGQVAGLDMVSQVEAYQQYHPKLLKSYAIEAMVKPETSVATPTLDLAIAFLKLATSGTIQSYASVGLGQDYRCEGPHFVGSALIVEEQVIHLAFFHLSGATENPSQMASYQQRRRFRNA